MQYTSPSIASSRAKSGSFASSPGTKRRFSRSNTSPTPADLTAGTDSLPGSPGTKVTGAPIAAASVGTVTSSDISSTTRPLGRPRCEIRTGRPPRSRMCLIVGATRSMRVGSLTVPSRTGTLMSILVSTRPRVDIHVIKTGKDRGLPLHGSLHRRINCGSWAISPRSASVTSCWGIHNSAFAASATFLAVMPKCS